MGKGRQGNETVLREVCGCLGVPCIHIKPLQIEGKLFLPSKFGKR